MADCASFIAVDGIITAQTEHEGSMFMQRGKSDSEPVSSIIRLQGKGKHSYQGKCVCV